VTCRCSAYLYSCQEIIIFSWLVYFPLIATNEKYYSKALNQLVDPDISSTKSCGSPPWCFAPWARNTPWSLRRPRSWQGVCLGVVQLYGLRPFSQHSCLMILQLQSKHIMLSILLYYNNDIYYIYTHNICIQYTHKIINIYMLVPNQFQQIYTNYCTLLYMQIWMCSKLTDVGSLSCVANLYKQRHDNKSVLESNPSQTNSWLFWFSNHTSDRTWNETHVENQPLQLVAGLSCPTLAPISQTICTLWLFNIAMV